MRTLLAALLLFTVVTQAQIASAQNSRLPPDFFKGQTEGTYVFTPKLEKPCTTSRSGFCPNYGPGADQVPENWVMVRYKSRHAGGFDADTASLLMVYIPPCGDNCDARSLINGQRDEGKVHRWLNFALPAPVSRDNTDATPRAPIPERYGRGMPKTFTMVSQTEGQPANVHFNKFQRSWSDDDSNEYIPNSGQQPLSSCYGCHPNGLRAISPLGYHIDALENAKITAPNFRANEEDVMLEEASWRAVETINNAMVESGGAKAVKWDDSFSPATTYTKVLGPRLRNDAETRKEPFIRSCMTARRSYSVTDIFGRAPGRKNVYEMTQNANLDWKKVRDAMNCGACHNNIQRGAITNGTGQAQVSFKILVDQSMPDGYLVNPIGGETWANELDVDHRIALMNCLYEEFERL